MINILPLEFQHYLFRENIMFFNYYFIYIINKNNMSISLSQTSKFWFIFQNLTCEFIDDVISVIPSEICGRLTNAAKHFEWQKQYFTHSLRSIVKPLENKIHILAPPCNILYINRTPLN